MRHELALRASDVVGVGRLAFDAIIGLTDVVVDATARSPAIRDGAMWDRTGSTYPTGNPRNRNRSKSRSEIRATKRTRTANVGATVSPDSEEGGRRVQISSA